MGDFQQRTLLAVLVASLSLRLLLLTEQSYWVDELLSVATISHPWPDLLDAVLFGVDSHPPLFPFMAKSWAMVFGDSKAGLRSFSAVLGTLLVYLTYQFGRQVSTDRIALGAALFSAVSPFALYYSQEVRGYALLAVLTTASWVCLLRYSADQTRVALVGWIVASIAAFYTHIYASLVLAGQAVFWLATARRDRRVVAALLIIGITFVPWAIVILSVKANWLAMESMGFQKPFGPGVVAYGFYALFFGYSLGPSVEELHVLVGLGDVFREYGTITTLAMFAAGIPILFGCMRVMADRFLFWLLISGLLVPAILALIASLVTNVAFNVRQLIPVLPFLHLVVSEGIVAAARRPTTAWLLVPLPAVLAVSCFNYFTDTKYWREDYEGVVAVLEARPAPVLASGGAAYWLQQLEPSLETERLTEAALRELEPDSRSWVVWNRAWGSDPDGAIRRRVESLRNLGEEHFPGFVVQEVVKPR